MEAASAQRLVVFERAEDLFFSGMEVKTPTLPKAGRIGHTK
jgi:hypothetical protein